MDPNLVLFALIGPFLVWPIEYFLPFPFLVEEVFKLILIFFFPQKSIKPVIYAGIAFATTETVLYSLNINASGDVGLFFVRFITTAILHSVTFLTIYLVGKKSKWTMAVGLIIAILIHYLYNRYI